MERSIDVRERYEDRIKMFDALLFEEVFFQFDWKNDSVLAKRFNKPAKFCKFTIQELLDQQITRCKIASISYLIMPHLEAAEYYEFAEEILLNAQKMSDDENPIWKTDADCALA